MHQCRKVSLCTIAAGAALALTLLMHFILILWFDSITNTMHYVHIQVSITIFLSFYCIPVKLLKSHFYNQCHGVVEYIHKMVFSVFEQAINTPVCWVVTSFYFASVCVGGLLLFGVCSKLVCVEAYNLTLYRVFMRLCV